MSGEVKKEKLNFLLGPQSLSRFIETDETRMSTYSWKNQISSNKAEKSEVRLPI